MNCPFTCRDKTFLEATDESRFFMQDEDGNFMLKKDHA